MAGAVSVNTLRGNKMKIGDLVKYINHYGKMHHWKEIGIILREIPGTDYRKVVQWSSGMKSSYPARDLEVISESR